MTTEEIRAAMLADLSGQCFQVIRKVCAMQPDCDPDLIAEQVINIVVGVLPAELVLLLKTPITERLC